MYSHFSFVLTSSTRFDLYYVGISQRCVWNSHTRYTAKKKIANFNNDQNSRKGRIQSSTIAQKGYTYNSANGTKCDKFFRPHTFCYHRWRHHKSALRLVNFQLLGPSSVGYSINKSSQLRHMRMWTMYVLSSRHCTQFSFCLCPFFGQKNIFQFGFIINSWFVSFSEICSQEFYQK